MFGITPEHKAQLLDTLAQDVRYGLRMFRTSPGFTSVAIAMLALGIGANTAIFSVINSVLIRPLPFKDSGQLVGLWETEPSPGNHPLAGPDYLDWKAQSKTIQAVSLYTGPWGYNASGAGEPEFVEAARVETNFLSLLGVEPAVGRVFQQEDRGTEDRVAILSNGFWHRHFGGEEDAIGKTLELNNEPYTIIGVVPNWFNFPAGTDVWVSLNAIPRNLGSRGDHGFFAIGRLRDRVTVAQAQVELSTIAKRVEKQYPDTNTGIGALVLPLKQQLTGYSERPLLMLLGAVGLVLLVACANMANLLLARGVRRQREITTRALLGATRRRLIRQLLTESVLISVTGATLGVLGAWWSVKLLVATTSIPVLRQTHLQLDGKVLLFSASITIAVGILFGLAPALRFTKLNLNEEVKSGGQTSVTASGGHRFLHDAIVICEISASLALLIGASLLIRTFTQLQKANIGVVERNILTTEVTLSPAKYSTLPSKRQFFDQLLDRIGRAPGVQAASISSEIPLEGGSNGWITVSGSNGAEPFKQIVEWNYIAGNYFETFGIRFIAGRNFTPEDAERSALVTVKLDELFGSGKSPSMVPAELSFVAIINRTMQRTYWFNQEAIGKTFKLGGLVPVTIIGVVSDVNEWGIRDAPIPQAYFPLTRALDSPGFSGHIAVKSSLAPATILHTIHDEVRALDTSLALFHTRTMQEVIGDAMQTTKLETYMLGLFAALGLGLAAVGIYSVMAFAVSQRTHEIGIRIALGAEPGDVWRLVLGKGMKLALIGVVIGIAAAFGFTRFLVSELYGVSATDPLTFAVVPAAMLLVAISACYFPARRAIGVEPLVALRYE
jgi:putative ABC transport system permease protein